MNCRSVNPVTMIFLYSKQLIIKHWIFVEIFPLNSLSNKHIVAKLTAKVSTLLLSFS